MACRVLHGRSATIEIWHGVPYSPCDSRNNMPAVLASTFCSVSQHVGLVCITGDFSDQQCCCCAAPFGAKDTTPSKSADNDLPSAKDTHQSLPDAASSAFEGQTPFAARRVLGFVDDEAQTQGGRGSVGAAQQSRAGTGMAPSMSSELSLKHGLAGELPVLMTSTAISDVHLELCGLVSC